MRSYKKFFQDKDHTTYAGYSKDQYDTLGFMLDRFKSNNQNMIGRLQNCFARAIQDEIILPKMVIIVPDDDLIHFLNHPGPGLTKSLSKICDALTSEFSRLAELQKSYLPKRAKKQEFPKCIWIEAPLHHNFPNNDECSKFNKAMREAAMFHDDTFVLMLKKIWDGTNPSLYSAEYRHYTNEGFSSYWIAIDATIKFADTILLKIKKQKITDKNIKQEDRGSNVKAQHRRRRDDRYHWSRTESHRSPRRSEPDRSSPRRPEYEVRGRKFPTPPRYQKYPEKNYR